MAPVIPRAPASASVGNARGCPRPNHSPRSGRASGSTHPGSCFSTRAALSSDRLDRARFPLGRRAGAHVKTSASRRNAGLPTVRRLLPRALTERCRSPPPATRHRLGSERSRVPNHACICCNLRQSDSSRQEAGGPISASGRAPGRHLPPASHARGRWFEPSRAHGKLRASRSSGAPRGRGARRDRVGRT
jgi:hypothetical protein